MASTADEYLALIAPQFNAKTNWLSLDGVLETGNTISVTVNGQTAVALFITDSDTTLDLLVTNLELLPVVETAERSGLVITVENERDEILLSGIVTGGASQAVITIGTIDNTIRDEFLLLAPIQTNALWYKGKFNYAVALRAAHLLTLDAQASTVTGASGALGNGVVESLKQGDLALKYGSISENDGDSNGVKLDLGRTTYGITLMGLKSAANFTMMSTGSMSL